MAATLTSTCASAAVCHRGREGPPRGPAALTLAAAPVGHKELLGTSPSLSLSLSPAAVVSVLSGTWSQTRRLAATRAAFGVEGKNVLILNTDSGGHAIIGFWLAKRLRGFGHSVTIATVGAEDSPKMDKPPFNRFNEMREVGVRTVWGSPSDLSEAVGVCDPFDVVLDNNGKDLAACKPVVDWAQERGAKQYLYVSSAGIYKTSYETPHVEGDPVKEGGHSEVEQYIASKAWESGWAVFRPQYITGSGKNKDCEEWFFDRLVRGRPLPIPGPGIQLTVITHAADIADIIVSAVNYPESAAGGIFNAVSGRAVTFDGLARLCAKAAGMEANIVHYDPAAVGVDAKKAFPFRNTHFFAEPRAVREKLQWTSVLDLGDILDARFEEYVSKGRFEEDITFDLDDKILAAVGN